MQIDQPQCRPAGIPVLISVFVVVFDLFVLCSLESTYEAARTFQILGVEKDKSLIGKACKFAAEKLASPASSPAKDLFHAVRISGALGCSVDAGVYDVSVSCRDLGFATWIVMFDGVLSLIRRMSWCGLRQSSRISTPCWNSTILWEDCLA
jgi:hypothetical protein